MSQSVNLKKISKKSAAISLAGVPLFGPPEAVERVFGNFKPPFCGIAEQRLLKQSRLTGGLSIRILD